MFSHSTGSNFTLVTMGRPISTPKIVPSCMALFTPIYTAHNPSSQTALNSFSTNHQTDRQTDRQEKCTQKITDSYRPLALYHFWCDVTCHYNMLGVVCCLSLNLTTVRVIVEQIRAGCGGRMSICAARWTRWTVIIVNWPTDWHSRVTYMRRWDSDCTRWTTTPSSHHSRWRASPRTDLRPVCGLRA